MVDDVAFEETTNLPTMEVEDEHKPTSRGNGGSRQSPLGPDLKHRQGTWYELVFLRRREMRFSPRGATQKNYYFNFLLDWDRVLALGAQPAFVYLQFG